MCRCAWNEAWYVTPLGTRALYARCLEHHLFIVPSLLSDIDKLRSVSMASFNVLSTTQSYLASSVHHWPVAFFPNTIDNAKHHESFSRGSVEERSKLYIYTHSNEGSRRVVDCCGWHTGRCSIPSATTAPIGQAADLDTDSCRHPRGCHPPHLLQPVPQHALHQCHWVS